MDFASSTDANREKYKVSETKTKTMHFNAKNQSEKTSTFNGKTLENVQRYKHLGIIRDRNSKLSNEILIEERIKTARCSVYALMGAGLHGLNGVNPEVSISMWQTYVRPRLMYGLESVYLSKSDISKLELYQRKVLRQILHLPERELLLVPFTYCLDNSHWKLISIKEGCLCMEKLSETTE